MQCPGICLESHAEPNVPVEQGIEQHSRAQFGSCQIPLVLESPRRPLRQQCRGAIGLLGKRSRTGRAQARKAIERQSGQFQSRKTRRCRQPPGEFSFSVSIPRRCDGRNGDPPARPPGHRDTDPGDAIGLARPLDDRDHSAVPKPLEQLRAKSRIRAQRGKPRVDDVGAPPVRVARCRRPGACEQEGEYQQEADEDRGGLSE